MERELWLAVERALDARRSPFADTELAARLARAPEAERTVLRLVHGLEQVKRAETRQPRSGRPRLVLACAAVALVALGACWRFAASPEPRSAPTVHLSVARVRTAPRLARITLEPTHALGWTLEGIER